MGVFYQGSYLKHQQISPGCIKCFVIIAIFILQHLNLQYVLMWQTRGANYWAPWKQKLERYDPLTPLHRREEPKPRSGFICLEWEEQHGGAAASTVASQQEGLIWSPPDGRGPHVQRSHAEPRYVDSFSWSSTHPVGTGLGSSPPMRNNRWCDGWRGGGSPAAAISLLIFLLWSSIILKTRFCCFSS